MYVIICLQDYIRSIDETAFILPKDKQEDNKKVDNKSSKTSIPSSVLPGLTNLLIGVVCMVGHLVLSGYFPMYRIYDREYIANNPNYFKRYEHANTIF
jgi:hypothetical protein